MSQLYDRTRDILEETLELLIEIEWGGSISLYPPVATCPCCGSDHPRHDLDCKIFLLREKIKEEL